MLREGYLAGYLQLFVVVIGLETQARPVFFVVVPNTPRNDLYEPQFYFGGGGGGGEMTSFYWIWTRYFSCSRWRFPEIF